MEQVKVMIQGIKNQDKIGIITSIGISVLAVGFGFFGNTAIEGQPPIQGQNIEVIGIGGITDIKESIKISMDSSSIDLDTTDGQFRASVTYEGYQPQMGRVMLEVYSATGEKVKESELQLRQRGNGVYEADFMQYFDKNELKDNDAVGQYIMRVSTEHGTLAKQAPFAITMSSMAQPKEVFMVQSNVITTSGIGGKLAETAPKLGFNLEVMETDLENSIIKKYLSKILKEYYSGDISKDEIKRLTQFKNIECDLTNGISQTGESLQLSCEFKADN